MTNSGTPQTVGTVTERRLSRLAQTMAEMTTDQLEDEMERQTQAFLGMGPSATEVATVRFLIVQIIALHDRVRALEKP